MSNLSLRLPDSLHRKIRELAERDDISINQFIATAVAEKAAALLTVGSDGKIARASLTVGGVALAPLRMTAIEEALVGGDGSEDRFRDLCEACREIEAMGDVYASTEYRQHLATVMSRRALVKAYGRASGTA